MKHVYLALCMTGLAASADAGGLVVSSFDSSPESVIAESSVSWTGNYGGILLGYGNVTLDSFDRNSFGGTFSLARMHDYGSWVGAVELLASPGFDAEVDGNEIKWGVAARVKAGRKFGDGGRWLAFGSAGFGRAKTEQIGSGRETATNGYLYGLGVAYMLKDNIAISGEFVHVEKNGDNDADADGAMLGILYKF